MCFLDSISGFLCHKIWKRTDAILMVETQLSSPWYYVPVHKGEAWKKRSLSICLKEINNFLLQSLPLFLNIHREVTFNTFMHSSHLPN